MRRTSALKERIDHLLDDITILRDIVLILTRGYNIPQDPGIIQMVEQTLCHGKWSYLPELSRILDQHITTITPAAQSSQKPEILHALLANIPLTQPSSMSYIGSTYTPVEQDTIQTSPTAIVASPSWLPHNAHSIADCLC
jgi:hypothetical protein